MSLVDPTVFPKDLTMTLASNRIQNEKKEFATQDDRIFIPNAGPFFQESLIIKDPQGVMLKPIVDFQLLYLNEEASKESNRNVVSVIRILKEPLAYVTLEYRVIGGEYGNTVYGIMQELKKGGPIRDNVDWNIHVYNKPEVYPAAPHFHTLDDIVGKDDIWLQLEGIRKAIIAGDEQSWESIFAYIDRLLASSRYEIDTSGFASKTYADNAVRVAIENLKTTAIDANNSALIKRIEALEGSINTKLSNDYYNKNDIDTKLTNLRVKRSVKNITGDYTVSLTDVQSHVYIRVSGTSAKTITIPKFGNNDLIGRSIVIQKTNTSYLDIKTGDINATILMGPSKNRSFREIPDPSVTDATIVNPNSSDFRQPANLLELHEEMVTIHLFMYSLDTWYMSVDTDTLYLWTRLRRLRDITSQRFTQIAGTGWTTSQSLKGIWDKVNAMYTNKNIDDKLANESRSRLDAVRDVYTALDALKGQNWSSTMTVKSIKDALDSLSRNLSNNYHNKSNSYDRATIDKKLKEAEVYKVGDIYVTTLDHRDGAAVAKHLGYGTWARFSEGKVLVGKSTNSQDPNWTKTIKSTFGSYEHRLTVDEMPNHHHRDGNNQSVWNRAGYWDLSGSGTVGLNPRGQPLNIGGMGDKGGDRPHNNVQPSITVGYWVRTA